MKKLPIIAWTLFAALNLTAFAHVSQGRRRSTLSTTAQEEPSLRNIRGTVKADGGKLTFVTDDDGKTWDIMNPETLKGHEGHHVELNAHLYAEKGVIHVHSVKMLNNPKDKLAGTRSL